MKTLKETFIHTRVLVLFLCLTVSISSATYAGRLVAWGNEADNRINVPEGDDFIAVSASWKRGLALRADGSIVGWGQNNWGQSDPPPGHDFIAISAGQLHSLALRSDGSLYAWGYNDKGQANVPVGNDFIAVSGGDSHSLALKSDGSIVAWGESEEGEGLITLVKNAMAIDAGHNYSVALTASGQLVQRGRCSQKTSCFTPQGSDFTAIAVDSALFGNHGLALRADGSIVAWGDNDEGQSVSPQGHEFITIAAGFAHSLAIRADGSLLAWGSNTYGESDVPNIPGKFIAVAGGLYFTVAIVDFSDIENIPPVADAGRDLVAHANEEVVLDGSGSYDPDGSIVTYTWRRLPDNVVLYSGPEPTFTTRALGRVEEIIELTVTDDLEGSSSSTMTITNTLVQNEQD